MWQYVVAYSAHTTNKSTHLLTAQKRKPHKRSYLSEEEGFGKQRSGEWAKSTKKGEDRKSDMTRQENKGADVE